MIDCRVKIMELKTAIVVSCWFTVAIVSSVYMLVFGREIDVMFGVLLPIGFLILIALIVTFMVLSSTESNQNPKNN
jgi:hypothetical protein